MLKIDFSNFFKNKKEQTEIFGLYKDKVKEAHKKLNSSSSNYSNNLEWFFDLVNNGLEELLSVSNAWRKNENIKTIIVIANGLSLFSLKAFVNMCLSPFESDKEIIFVSNLSSFYISSLINKLKKEDFYLFVVSKSGSTFEINVTFRIFFDLLFQRVGGEVAKERIVCITNETKGTLREIINTYSLKSFQIIDSFEPGLSILCPLGIFMCSYIGLDVDLFIQGIQQAIKDTSSYSLSKNMAYQYAVVRVYANQTYNKSIEIFGVYDEQFLSFSEYLKHLMSYYNPNGENLFFPMNFLFSTDQYSVGKLFKKNSHLLFQTILKTHKPILDVVVEPFMNNTDGLEIIDNKSVHELNNITVDSIVKHQINDLDEKKQVKSIVIEIEKENEYFFGYLYFWMANACFMSLILMNINPFTKKTDEYKKVIFESIDHELNKENHSSNDEQI